MRISDWSSDVCSSDLLAQSLADLQARLQSEGDRGKVEAIRKTMLPDFTAKVGEAIEMLTEANEIDRNVLIPNGVAIAEKVAEMRNNALTARDRKSTRLNSRH